MGTDWYFRSCRHLTISGTHFGMPSFVTRQYRQSPEEVFDSWVLDEVKARKWERKKNLSIVSVNKNETSADVSMSLDDLQIETYG